MAGALEAITAPEARVEELIVPSNPEVDRALCDLRPNGARRRQHVED